MQHLKLIAAFLLLISSFPTQAQTSRAFEQVEGDPLNARIYTLTNGLKVYLTINKKEPRIQSFIAVKAGSRNDPAHATGLAHYLEHMLFKGTDRISALEPEKELKLIASIEAGFEKYRQEKDSLKRKAIYREIDSLSTIASKLAVTGEYDKLMADLGSSGTNAYTWVDQTVYMNEIPSNQMEKFFMIEAERFRRPVLRLFHTELEAVYEEKNRSLDSDFSQIYETLFANLFPGHPYGTQTTIGTIEHLKNPSMKEIRQFYDTYYVPNNMAICLSGDLEFEPTMELIEKYFGNWKSKTIPETKKVELPATSEIQKIVEGPEAEHVLIGIRLPGAGTPEADMAAIINKILFNGQAGLIDMELNQNQRIIDGYASFEMMKDYSIQLLGGKPRTGEALEEVAGLLQEMIIKAGNGEFASWLPAAVLANMEVEQMKLLEDNSKRASEFVTAFTLEIPWEHHIRSISRYQEINIEKIKEFIHANYVGKSVIVLKKTGSRPVVKVTKPEITPIQVVSGKQSAFAQRVREMQSDELQPVFVDYQSEIRKTELVPGIELLVTQNRENRLFQFNYYWEMGSAHDPYLPLALEYLELAGSREMNAEAFRQELYKRGSTFSTQISPERTIISLSGLDNQVESAIRMLDLFMSTIEEKPYILQELIQTTLKKREDAKKSRNIILRQALYNYAVYGESSPFNTQLSEKEIKNVTIARLVESLKKLQSTKHRLLYYGPQRMEQIAPLMMKSYRDKKPFLDIPESVVFQERSMTSNQVLFADYDMTQVEMLVLIKSDPFNEKELALQRLFNNYFNYQAFQELRESQALAYSAFGNFSIPDRKEKSHYMMGYIGSQADKLSEAAAGIYGMVQNVPLHQMDFESERQSLLEALRTERITGADILWSYLQLERLGLRQDYRPMMYEAAKKASIEDLAAYQETLITGRKHTLLVLGDKDKINLQSLSKFGTVKTLTLEELFGY